jgi:hypothetical protein
LASSTPVEDPDVPDEPFVVGAEDELLLLLLHAATDSPAASASATKRTRLLFTFLLVGAIAAGRHPPISHVGVCVVRCGAVGVRRSGAADEDAGVRQ